MIATPVIVDNVVYIANGQDPEHGEGVGHLYAIDATKRGDITQSGRLWHFDKIRRSISTASVKDGLVYYPDFSGFLYCLDAKTGKEIWMHDMFAAMWSSTMVADGKVYLGDEDGDVVVMQARAREESARRAEHGQLGVFDRDYRQRRDVHHDAQQPVCDSARRAAEEITCHRNGNLRSVIAAASGAVRDHRFPDFRDRISIEDSRLAITDQIADSRLQISD